MSDQPKATELFWASLVATGIVYASGSLILLVLTSITPGELSWSQMMEAVFFFAFIGVLMATAAGFLLVAPLGTAFGLAMLRVSPPGWWQGPLTGLLVAIALEAFVFGVFGINMVDWTAANLFTLSLPLVLSLIAGAFVQQRVLHWPE